ncbi:MAG: AmmeMemoRadiSam system protein B, partial [Thermoprotei archaeon]|nr:AmmeMemoRadiSam system protein B [Thermoprotei archaeon]
MRIRKPAVAGLFYEGTPESLKKRLEWCFKHKLGPGKLPKVNPQGSRRIVGLIVPHAGYMYSGPVAANAYYALALDGIPEIFIILGPNHQGVGSLIATCESEVWQTPLGDVLVDTRLAKEIVKESGIVDIDDEAHKYEHSIEVQLPFLQYIYESNFKIVPIAMMLQDMESSRILGNALAKVLKESNAVIIASSDFTHYEP